MEILYKSVGDFSGYSIVAAHYVKFLRDIGIKVQFKPIYFNRKFKRQFSFLFDKARVGTDAFIINHSISNPTSKEVLYQVWDGATCPQDLVNYANNSWELWTCSEFSKRSYYISGTDRHIEIIPHGVDTGIFNPNQKPLHNFKRFTFLTMMFSHDAKENTYNLCIAFLKEFAGDPVQLLIHTRPDQREALIKDLKMGLGYPQTLNQIKFTKKFPLTMKEIAQLYASCDAYVSATKGESFSLNAIEAGAMDLPVIITQFGGQVEFLKDNAFLVYSEKYEIMPLITKDALFAKPSELMLRMQMRFVYGNYDYAKMIGRRLGRDIRKNWTWEEACKKIIKRLEILNGA